VRYRTSSIRPVRILTRLTADEELEFILIMRTPGPSDVLDDTAPRPSADLLSFFAHIQVALEASYIQPAAASGPGGGSPGGTRLGAPPRTASLKPSKHRPPNLHPSIFPPQTPHPTPSVAGSDRQYVRSEGTPLISKTWGEEDNDDFSLLWSKKDRVWLALYRMTVGVGEFYHTRSYDLMTDLCPAFLRLEFMDPLLCLTVSTTLREQLLPIRKGGQTLHRLLDAAGGVPKSAPHTPIEKVRDEDGEDDVTGLEEVNLLGGLRTG
jgi:hypothetical protein